MADVSDLPNRRLSMRIMLTKLDEDAIDFYHLGFKVRPVPGLAVMWYPAKSATSPNDPRLTLGCPAPKSGDVVSLFINVVWK